MMDQTLDREEKKAMLQARIRAFAVHIFTAMGAYFALLSIVAAAEGNITAAWWWLGVTLLIDGVDGPIARKARVAEILPTWSGIMLDNVIDYMTYAIIPAFIFYMGGLMSGPLLYCMCGVIVVSSAVYYADTEMKVKENFFKGFPVTWNMLVFALFVIQPPVWAMVAVIMFSAFMMFVPVNFLHPVRVKRFRAINLGVLALWCGLGALSLLNGFIAPLWVIAAFVVCSIYLYAIGGILQAFPKLGAKAAEGKPSF